MFAVRLTHLSQIFFSASHQPPTECQSLTHHKTLGKLVNSPPEIGCRVNRSRFRSSSEWRWRDDAGDTDWLTASTFTTPGMPECGVPNPEIRSTWLALEVEGVSFLRCRSYANIPNSFTTSATLLLWHALRWTMQHKHSVVVCWGLWDGFPGGADCGGGDYYRYLFLFPMFNVWNVVVSAWLCLSFNVLLKHYDGYYERCERVVRGI